MQEQQIPERIVALAEKIKERRGFWVKSFSSKKELRAWIPRIQKVNNEAFSQVWGYYPIDAAEVQLIGQQLLTIANPRLLKVVMKDDDIAGFAFIFPDVSAALREVRGRLWPFGWIKVLWAIQTTRRMSGNGVGLLPQYQGFGATALLYVELEKTLRSVNTVHCDVAQVMESNLKSMDDLNMLKVNWYKRHRVYRRVV
jgi:GNAT superfamily N-acetyltransferase